MRGNIRSDPYVGILCAEHVDALHSDSGPSDPATRISREIAFKAVSLTYESRWDDGSHRAEAPRCFDSTNEVGRIGNEMKRITVLSLALLAVTAVSSIAVTSASATLPEFVAAKFPDHFTTSSILPREPLLAFPVGNPVVCKKRDGLGFLTGPRTHTVKYVYLQCVEEEPAGSNVCTSAGEPSGSIATKSLTGRIGYVEKATKKVGSELEPETGTVIDEFTCAGLDGKMTVEGCTIGEMTPINKSQITSEVLFEANAAKNGQKWIEIEGGTHKPCEMSATGTVLKLKGKAWLTDEDLNTFSEVVELKA